VEVVIISLLTLNAVVGLLVLLFVILHYRQGKRATSLPSIPPQDAPSSSIDPVLQAAIKPLSSIEKKYLALFMEGKTTEKIAEIMHVEPATVYTMKYRIKKKYPADYPFPF
jgi:DNA-binding CsgD family transcriptional regulator